MPRRPATEFGLRALVCTPLGQACHKGVRLRWCGGMVEGPCRDVSNATRHRQTCGGPSKCRTRACVQYPPSSVLVLTLCKLRGWALGWPSLLQPAVLASWQPLVNLPWRQVAHNVAMVVDAQFGPPVPLSTGSIGSAETRLEQLAVTRHTAPAPGVLGRHWSRPLCAGPRGHFDLWAKRIGFQVGIIFLVC